jgi:hypothetical protein
MASAFGSASDTASDTASARVFVPVFGSASERAGYVFAPASVQRAFFEWASSARAFALALGEVFAAEQRPPSTPGVK